MVEINYVANLIISILAMVFGFLWYGPLFGRKWMKLMGLSHKDLGEMKMNMGVTYFTAFITTIVTVSVLSYFVNLAVIDEINGASTFFSGAIVGFIVWLGFIATSTLGQFLWEGKPFSLYLLNNMHNLIFYLVVGGVLAVWV